MEEKYIPMVMLMKYDWTYFLNFCYSVDPKNLDVKMLSKLLNSEDVTVHNGAVLLLSRIPDGQLRVETAVKPRKNTQVEEVLSLFRK